MRSLIMFGVLASVVALGLAAQPASNAAAATMTVSVQDNHYTPPTVTINVGDTVHWAWAGVNPHTVTATDSSFDSGAPQTSGSFDHTFNTAGTFTYFCQVHGAQVMSGTVIVQQAAAPTSTMQPAAGATTAPGATSTAAASSTPGTGTTPAAAASPTRSAQATAPAAAAPTTGSGAAGAGAALPRAGTGTAGGGSSVGELLAIALGLVGVGSIAFAVMRRRQA